MQETVELIKGEPRVIKERITHQDVIEYPEVEVHNITQPGQKTIEHIINKVPATCQRDVVEWETNQPACRLLDTRVIKKKSVHEVEQIIEVPRQVEEIVYVDVPEYEIVEVPEYYPVVVSRRIEPRVDDSKKKIVEDVCYIPYVAYDATKDPKQMEEMRKKFVKTEMRGGVATRGEPAAQRDMAQEGTTQGVAAQQAPKNIKQTVTRLGMLGKKFGWTS
eukprot:Blabericola_migrator_1__13357@NODE_947_length_5922_cov_60_770623_g657_i0_p6_GENE_NODE_947_length_5922_cov_60_770623_g657_i0NODE_947_length_5922_cov_60_770623_g657_i0_p6_ORF_typecomplete_len219_score32_20RNA_pol_A_CTD/PF03118_15/7_5RNA_pol_A_CTD/PF03118_15/34Cornifin/PF02389_15/1_5e02Cornifin/PF02389_15/3_4_NODE_947_length_5922_cov_60_770623_g657_i043545010